jgi:hypothetical protein
MMEIRRRSPALRRLVTRWFGGARAARWLAALYLMLGAARVLS